MTYSALCLGDLHLGRRPSRLPQWLEEHGLSSKDLGPTAAWKHCVDYAIEQKVDSVWLAGDVVESANHFFEALTPLAAGAKRLQEAGVALLGVAGNHDVSVLPRLASHVPHLQIIGLNSIWQRVSLPSPEDPQIHLLGWSFSHAKHREDPLAELSTDSENFPKDGRPLVGLLHCDLDQYPSNYAPTRSSTLKQHAQVRSWLLGHIHTPGSFDDGNGIGYLGSVVGLDPTETGVHGPWLLQVDGENLHLNQIPLAPLRWEQRVLDLSQLENVRPGENTSNWSALEALESAIVRNLEEHAESTDLHHCRLVSVRLKLQGRSPYHGAIRDALKNLQALNTPLFCKGTLYRIEKIDDRARPTLNLQSIAAGTDPPALLARKLLCLENGNSTERTQLLQSARDPLQRTIAQPLWHPLTTVDLDDTALQARLVHSGIRLLEKLLEQSPSHIQQQGDLL